MTVLLIHLCDWLIGLLADVSLKSILLAAVAGAGMAVLRVRNSSIRHRVWTAVLTGMLVMPLLAAWRRECDCRHGRILICMPRVCRKSV